MNRHPGVWYLNWGWKKQKSSVVPVRRGLSFICRTSTEGLVAFWRVKALEDTLDDYIRGGRGLKKKEKEKLGALSGRVKRFARLALRSIPLTLETKQKRPKQSAPHRVDKLHICSPLSVRRNSSTWRCANVRKKIQIIKKRRGRFAQRSVAPLARSDGWKGLTETSKPTTWSLLMQPWCWRALWTANPELWERHAPHPNWIWQIQLMEHGLKHYCWFLRRGYDSRRGDFGLRASRALRRAAWSLRSVMAWQKGLLHLHSFFFLWGGAVV